MHRFVRVGSRPPPAPLLRALACAALVAGCDRSSQPVVFGLAGPFQTPYGESMRLGAELAAREINQSGGIQKRRLQLSARDDLANPDRAIAIADAFFEDPAVVAVVGHVNSGAMMAAAPSYQRGLPAVATSATSAQISRLGDWIFRVASSDSSNSVELAQVARRTGGPIAVLYENDNYGRGLAAGFRAALADDSGRVVGSDPYTADTRDLTPYLARIKARGVDLVFLAGLEHDAARIIQQARALGLQATFLGGDGIEGLVDMGAQYDGTRVGLLFHADASPEARAFARRFRDAYDREPDADAALGYDAAWLLAAAAREVGPDRERIREYLQRLGRESGTQPYAGVTGSIRFDANGDPVAKRFAVGVIRGGTIQLTGSE